MHIAPAIFLQTRSLARYADPIIEILCRTYPILLETPKLTHGFFLNYYMSMYHNYRVSITVGDARNLEARPCEVRIRVLWKNSFPRGRYTQCTVFVISLLRWARTRVTMRIEDTRLTELRNLTKAYIPVARSGCRAFRIHQFKLQPLFFGAIR